LAATVYLMCTFSALLCCVLLLRGYRQSRTPLLLWSGLCFAFLTLENLQLCLDRIVFPNTDLPLGRIPLAMIAVMLLLYGIVWKTDHRP
jgi:hypothetical protein